LSAVRRGSPLSMPTGEKGLNRKAELMLQVLLADRFELVTHREKRDQQTYGLVLSNRMLKK
jgi:uncharacterized protein (TIGR03435 family)